MGMTLSEEQEREDRAMSSCTLVSGQSASLWFALNRSHAEIDALRERVAEFERLLTYVRDSGYSVEDVDVTAEIDAALDGVAAKPAEANGAPCPAREGAAMNHPRDRCRCGRYEIATWSSGVYTLSESHLRERCTNDITHAEIVSGDEVFCHAGSGVGKTFTVTHADEAKNPYTMKHDPTRRDAWDEGYETASERLSLRIDALRERVKTLEGALEGVRPFIQEDFPDEDVNHPGACVTDRYRAAAIAMVRALAPLKEADRG